MQSYEQKVEVIRRAVVEALAAHEQVEPAAIIHGLTLVLSQAIVVLRGDTVKTPQDATHPVHQLLEETVGEWWELGEAPGGLVN